MERRTSTPTSRPCADGRSRVANFAMPAPPPLSPSSAARRSEIISEQFWGFDLIRFEDAFRDQQRLRSLTASRTSPTEIDALHGRLVAYPGYVLRFGSFSEARETWSASGRSCHRHVWHDIAAAELRWHLSASGMLDTVPTFAVPPSGISLLLGACEAAAFVAAIVADQRARELALTPSDAAKRLKDAGYRDLQDIDTTTKVIGHPPT